MLKGFQKIGFVFAALALALPLQASAEDQGEKNPWTECGIGAMIFDHAKWAAAISNVIWDLGTTAVTSAYSSKNTCEGKKVAAALFINETYANLEEETASGGGAHVASVLNIMGCDTAVQGEIVSDVRASFAQSVSDAAYAQKTSTEKAQAYYRVLDKTISGRYAMQCSAT